MDRSEFGNVVSEKAEGEDIVCILFLRN